MLPMDYDWPKRGEKKTRQKVKKKLNGMVNANVSFKIHYDYFEFTSPPVGNINPFLH